MTGPTTVMTALMPAKAVMPLKPLVADLPKLQDLSKWRSGKLIWADDAGEYDLISLARVQIPFTYNTGQVKAGDLTSWKDLLDPRWKGKIASRGPSKPGGALDISAFVYARPEAGQGLPEAALRRPQRAAGRR